ncbi:MAG: pepA [Frankiales bacterium]|nr:pepA [Frankiales bacterium]
MPTVSVVNSSAPLSADVIVIGTLATGDGVALAAGAQPVDDALGNVLLKALAAVEASGRQDEVIKIPTLGHSAAPLVIATGLGRFDPAGSAAALPEPEAIRRGVGAAMRSITTAKRVAIAIGSAGDPAVVGAISDGVLLGAYRFDRYKSAAKAPALKRVDIATDNAAPAAVRAVLRRSKIISEAVNNTRDLVNIPANVLNPVTFAAYAKENGEAAGLKVEVLDERGLKRGGFGGILGVGAGSATPPRLVRLSYTPARAKTSVSLVGKGITFDTGGLDLKNAMMAQMKSDMGGAAAVIEALLAVAKLRLPIAVTATVPMAENAVSGTAYRPSDILTMRDGRTVEVDNTDAEGRLILADAILRACEDEPDYLIETSTLTGAQLVALGTHTTGAMGSDEFRDRVVALGNAAGESLWAMPLPSHLRAGLDSPVADIVNLPKDRWASMLVAGLFLADFVPEGIDWVHLDIAGPSFANSASGYTPRGGTGVIVRTIIAALSDLSD